MTHPGRYDIVYYAEADVLYSCLSILALGLKYNPQIKTPAMAGVFFNLLIEKELLELFQFFIDNSLRHRYVAIFNDHFLAGFR